MKITVYNYRADEVEFLEKFRQKYQVELTLCRDFPKPENAELVRGGACMSMITTPMPRELLEVYHSEGIRFISTRSIGYDHINVRAARELGVHIGNVTYSPASVADYTVMLILMAIRKVKPILGRSAQQDYSLAGVRGMELHNLTVGVVGTGRIGTAVLQRLSGFGCRLLAYDLYPNENAAKLAEYVPVETLLGSSDIIDLHMPATKENYHFINRETLAEMKDGVYLINTARGSLIDTADFIDAVESGKIGGAALDVVEHETGLYYSDLKCKVLANRELALLRSYPNVTVTPHTAFYTDQAVGDMVEHSLLSCILFSQGKENPWQVV